MDASKGTSSPPPIPKVPKELLEWLERAYPNKLPPAIKDPLGFPLEVAQEMGKQHVIRKLRVAYDEQMKLAMEQT